MRSKAEATNRFWSAALEKTWIRPSAGAPFREATAEEVRLADPNRLHEPRSLRIDLARGPNPGVGLATFSVFDGAGLLLATQDESVALRPGAQPPDF